MALFVRKLEEKIIQQLKVFSCVYINGPRQVGKSTLIKEILNKYFNKNATLKPPFPSSDAVYLSFDDPFILSNAKENPMEFLSQYFNTTIILDEIQMLPEIFRPLKIRIDELREKKLDGKIKTILTGSTNLMAIPKLADALVGRMSILTLYPLSAIETTNNKVNFIDFLINGNFEYKKIFFKTSLDDIILKTTFPEIVSKNLDKINLNTWIGDYVRTILERDVKQISQIQKIDIFPKLLKQLAIRSGSLFKSADISRDLGIDAMMLSRYRTFMENVFLIKRLQAWSSNIGKREVKSPKLFFYDSLLLLSLIGADIKELKEKNKGIYGHLVENFVCMELTKQISFFDNIKNDSLYYYNNYKKEVDFIIEIAFEEIIGIEVKTKKILNFSEDTKGLQDLQNTIGKKFKRGFVLYMGDNIQNLGKNIWAIPINMMWEH